jgi:hypothetical protein
VAVSQRAAELLVGWQSALEVQALFAQLQSPAGASSLSKKQQQLDTTAGHQGGSSNNNDKSHRSNVGGSSDGSESSDDSPIIGHSRCMSIRMFAKVLQRAMERQSATTPNADIEVVVSSTAATKNRALSKLTPALVLSGVDTTTTVGSTASAAGGVAAAAAAAAQRSGAVDLDDDTDPSDDRNDCGGVCAVGRVAAGVDLDDDNDDDDDDDADHNHDLNGLEKRRHNEFEDDEDRAIEFDNVALDELYLHDSHSIEASMRLLARNKTHLDFVDFYLIYQEVVMGSETPWKSRPTKISFWR